MNISCDTNWITRNTYSALDLKDAGVAAPLQLNLFMAVIHTEDPGPGGPGVVGCARWWGLGQDLKCCDALGALKNKNKSVTKGMFRRCLPDKAWTLGQAGTAIYGSSPYNIKTIQYNASLLPNVEVITQGMCNGAKYTDSHIHSIHKMTRLCYSKKKQQQSERDQGPERPCRTNTQGSLSVLKRCHTNTTKTLVTYSNSWVGWVLLYIHRNRRLITDGNPGRPLRLSHSSWAFSVTLTRYANKYKVPCIYSHVPCIPCPNVPCIYSHARWVTKGDSSYLRVYVSCISCIPDENYRRPLRSLLSCSHDSFPILINSLVCWINNNTVVKSHWLTDRYISPEITRLSPSFKG